MDAGLCGPALLEANRLPFECAGLPSRWFGEPYATRAWLGPSHIAWDFHIAGKSPRAATEDPINQNVGASNTDDGYARHEGEDEAVSQPSLSRPFKE